MTLLQSILAPLLLPPIGLVVLAALAGLLAWRGRARAGMLATLACLALLALATPLAAGLLHRSLDQDIPAADMAGPSPGAIIILGGDIAHGRDGADVGRLTLERLRAGAALHRRTGLPILVTGGVLMPGQPPLSRMMAESLAEDFSVEARWIETEAGDTRDNAVLSAALLRREGIASALVVTQAFHMPRALAAFARQDFAARPAPVRQSAPVQFSASTLVPRADHLAESWFAIHEWAGRIFYAVRDGAGAAL